jgi:putative transposase
LIECSNEANEEELIVLDFKKKCELLNVPRSSMYYEPRMLNDNSDTIIINELVEIYQKHSFYGYRRMTIKLQEMGFLINHKRVRRLLNIAGIQAIYPTKKTTIRNPQHKVFPYLLNDIKIDQPNQVWKVDITYIKIRGGFVYLICLIDAFSRKIMGWKLSTFLDTASCLEALDLALQNGIPTVINSDQGCQFTSDAWINALQAKKIQVSMDGKGRWVDNILIERLWRTIKYELIYLHSFDTVQQLRDELEKYIIFYNQERRHMSLNYHTPNEIFALKTIPTKQELLKSFALKNAKISEAPMI